MTIGFFGVLSSPVLSSSGSGSSPTKTSRVESGDHWKSPAPPLRVVSRRASPPWRLRIQICPPVVLSSSPLFRLGHEGDPLAVGAEARLRFARRAGRQADVLGAGPVRQPDVAFVLVAGDVGEPDGVGDPGAVGGDVEIAHVAEAVDVGDLHRPPGTILAGQGSGGQGERQRRGGDREQRRAESHAGPSEERQIMSRLRFRLTRWRAAERIRASMNAGKRLGILVGGGPAPGINAVISSAAIEAINEGFEVVGHPGRLQEPGPARPLDKLRPLTIDDVSRMHLAGGSVLGTSRENPTKSPEAHAGGHRDAAAGRHHAPRHHRRRRHGALVAARSSERSQGTIRSVHVPKTIDNDLPLPPHVPTFGFQTARHVGVELVRNLMEDAAVDAALVRRRGDGPQGRPPRARASARPPARR